MLGRTRALVTDARYPPAESYENWRQGRRPPGGPSCELLVSVLVPVLDPAPELLRELARSVLDQDHRALQLVLADDGCRDPAVLALLDELAASDPRVLRVSAGGLGISGATNAAAAAAGGEVLAFADHDDVLAQGALGALARAYADDPSLELAFTDEDMLDERGQRVAPSFRPGPSPWLALGFNCAAHLLSVRSGLFERLGGLRSAFDGAQDHDLLLRGLEQASRARHLAFFGYHWRRAPGSVAASSTAKPWAYEAGRRAVQDACQRRGLDVRSVEQTRVPGVLRVDPTPARADVPLTLVLHGPAAARARWCRAPLPGLSIRARVSGRWPEPSAGTLLLVDARARPGPAPLLRLLAWLAQPGVRAVAGVGVSGGVSGGVRGVRGVRGGRRLDAGYALDIDGSARPVLPGSAVESLGPGLLAAAPREVAAAGVHLLALDATLVPACLAGAPLRHEDLLVASLAAAAAGAPTLVDPAARLDLGDAAAPGPQRLHLSRSAAWPSVLARLPSDVWTAAGHDRWCPRVTLLEPLGLPG